MAPIRRYLRITKYSVLECRIYLDNPASAHTWLLNPRKPVLPKVIESVRPYVLPKLREERERSRKRSTKKKGIKDVVVQDDFEVSIFLTETSTRHSLLTKHKHFHDTTQTKLTSNSGRLVGAANESPADLDTMTESAGPTILLREDSDDGDAAAALATIPAVKKAAASNGRRPKRPRNNTGTDAGRDGGIEVISDDEEDPVVAGEDDEDLFVNSSEDDEGARPPPAKRRKDGVRMAAGVDSEDGGDDDDKKKLAMDISYEGFSIYGRVLCLVVKRRDGAIGPNRAGRSGNAMGATGGNGSTVASRTTGGQAMMENFIISTQVPAGAEGS